MNMKFLNFAKNRIMDNAHFDGFRTALWYCLNQTPIPQFQLYYYFINNIITIYFSTYVRTRRVDEDPTAVTLVVLGLLYRN